MGKKGGNDKKKCFAWMLSQGEEVPGFDKFTEEQQDRILKEVACAMAYLHLEQQHPQKQQKSKGQPT